jgi:hypothetical protein
VTNTILDIGGITDTFTSTTLAIDTTPNTFTFVDQTNVALATVTPSAAITITGINAPAAISVSGAIDSEYQINGGAWTSAVGSVNNNDTVAVRHTSSPSNSTVMNTVLTVGGVSDTFTTTTLAPACDNSSWSAVNFTSTSLDKGTNCDTATRTLTGLCSGTAYSYTRSYTDQGGGGSTAALSLRINGAAVTITANAASGTVNGGDTVVFRFTNQNKDKGIYTSSLTIGGVTRTWTHNTNGSSTTCPSP